MAGYTADSFEEAQYNFQRDLSQHLYTMFQLCGVDMVDRENYRNLQPKDGNGYSVWGKNYEHIHLSPIVPQKVKYTPINSVVLERTPDKAAERRWQNGGSEIAEHKYSYSVGDERSSVSSTRNMQGLEISQTISVEAEYSGVKVGSETSVKVSAEFEQGYEKGRTISKAETDEMTVHVPSGKYVEVHTQKWNAKIKEVSEKNVSFDFGFEFHAHGSRNPKNGYFDRSSDYRKTGKRARRFAAFTSIGDFESFVRGINPRYPGQRNNLLSDWHMNDNMQWIKDNAQFVVNEETIFNDGSYGNVVIEEFDI